MNADNASASALPLTPQGPITIESLVLGDSIPVIENVVVNTDYDSNGDNPLDLVRGAVRLVF